MTEPARRTLLLAAAAAGLGAAGFGGAGCTSDGGGGRGTTASAGMSTRRTPAHSPDSEAPPTAPATPTLPTIPPEPPLPTASPWPLARTEVEPRAKASAVRLLEALGTWPRGQQGPGPARERARARDVPPARAAHLVTRAAPLLTPAPEATVRVIAAQYGGLAGDRASVLVPLRQWRRAADGSVVDGGATVDVRLTRAPSGWQVRDLHPSRPGRPLARPGPLIRRTVTHDRIHLPPAAEADIRAGHLRPAPLRALLTLAESYDIDISVIHTGHPRNVFGTSRLSDHTRMRAFDVWAVNGRTVIDPTTPDTLIDGFMRAAARAGAYRVGGPRLLGRGGEVFFTDRAHRDHLHIAFDSDE
ncbi:hypothetical protein [Streptomyces sp. YU58]|uniref:hypothetical protein n=1 Tax=Streptomyces sp. SX92 TaxID=3158972 RepID=UPI0027B97B7C|nr:hypothetical protein [Streptomyces coralus]WLW54259.1 hypothetical protein QU709_24165 [Streptomyces coralus]